jgi:hypothetical protein
MEEQTINAQEQALETQEAPQVLKIAVSPKRTKKLVDSLDEMSGE